MRLWVALLMLFSAIATAAPAKRAVIAPVASPSHDAAAAKLGVSIEHALIEATRAAGVELVNLDGGKLKAPARLDPKADPRPQVKAQALAHELSAELAISAEPQALGEGAVVYLQVGDGTGGVKGSTTVAVSAECLKTVGELERALRGGLVQILEPKAFTGSLELRIDVNGAQLEIDGKKTALPTSGNAIALSVGPHAVRVTHPAYRDFLRFVDIRFDRTESQQVTMAAFPLTEGEMDERHKRADTPKRKVKWYRSWWALTITGVVIAGATAGIAYGARSGLSADQSTGFRTVPAP